MSRLAELDLQPPPFLKQGDITPCATTGHPDLFVPTLEGVEGHRRDDSLARSICGGCPQQTECLMYALNHPYLEGVWGGMNDDQRDQWRRQYPAFVPSHPEAPWARGENDKGEDWVVVMRRERRSA